MILPRIALHAALLGVLLSALFGGLTGCGPPQVTFHAADPSAGVDSYPQRLSEWAVLQRQGRSLVPASDSLVYDLNMPLFSDYAHKLRTLHLPAGSHAVYQDFEAFDFPTGTVVSKTFFYGRPEQEGRGGGGVTVDLDHGWDGDVATIDLDRVHLLETRLLVRQDHGWDALPYVWRGDDAYLAITGELIELTRTGDSPVNYLVPSRNQCASCHATDHTSGALQPIGLKARHMNRAAPAGGDHQLEQLDRRGWLTQAPPASDIPASATLEGGDWSLDARARAYLDINCGHCHNPRGAADTSGLLLDLQPHDPGAMGVCKAPIAAGRGSGGFLYSIVPGRADQSILAFRMSTRDPATMMPELGRTLVHQEGLSLVSRWIDSLSGTCR